MAVDSSGGGQIGAWETKKTFRDLLVGLLDMQIKTPFFTAKDLKKDLADSGVALCCSTVRAHLLKYDSH